MRALVIVLFLFASLVKLAPVLGLLLPSRIPGAYGVSIEDANLLILLRHRAGLFAIVGVFLVAAAFRPRLRTLAATLGLYSMVSYIVVVWLDGPANSQLVRYAYIDLAAAAALVTALVLDRRGHRR